MVSTNEITGDRLQSKQSNKNWEEGYDRIFSKDAREKLKVVEERKSPCQLHEACSKENTCACTSGH